MAMTLKWTKKQIQAYGLCTSTEMSQAEIAKKVGCDPGTVRKVQHAIKQGESPSDIKKKKTKKKIVQDIFSVDQVDITNQKLPLTHASAPAVANFAVAQYRNVTAPVQEPLVEDGEVEDREDSEDREEGEDTGGGTGGVTPTKAPKEKSRATPPPVDLTSMLRLVSVPVTCILTPIMMNARFIAIREFGWREDMPWENFFDTCLYYLFDGWGYTLQGYYKKEESEEVPESGPPEVDGNGHPKVELTEEDLAMIVGIANYIKAQKAKEAEHAS